jgi:cellulose synthase/poly-beta-1,6-N-acetylglucosamine synthase-like glycosyltransferase
MNAVGATDSIQIAVVIPALTCPCRQADKVLNQLGLDDRLVIVYERGVMDLCECAKRLFRDSRVIQIIGPHKYKGAAFSRNFGVRNLGKCPNVLLFCDADDLVDEEWVVKLSGPLINGVADLTGGALRIKNTKNSSKPALPRIDYWYRLALFGSNMGITGFAWESLHGFDETLRYSEDTDIAWRAADMGFRVTVMPDAAVNYTLRGTVLKEVRQRFNWGKAAISLFRKHGIKMSNLPGLSDLINDKQSTGFARYPFLAAVAQWLGQRFGKLLTHLLE